MFIFKILFKNRLPLITIILLIATILLTGENIKSFYEVNDPKSLTTSYLNDQFKYFVSIPDGWIKIEDTGSYVVWLTPNAYQDRSNGKKESAGAKLSIAVLNNSTNLSVEEWKLKYSNQNSFLVYKEGITFNNMQNYIYVYNSPNTTVNGHINVYLPVKDYIISIAIFPYDNDIQMYKNYIQEISESFNMPNMP